MVINISGVMAHCYHSLCSKKNKSPPNATPLQEIWGKIHSPCPVHQYTVKLASEWVKLNTSWFSTDDLMVFLSLIIIIYLYISLMQWDFFKTVFGLHESWIEKIIEGWIMHRRHKLYWLLPKVSIHFFSEVLLINYLIPFHLLLS